MCVCVCVHTHIIYIMCVEVSSTVHKIPCNCQTSKFCEPNDKNLTCQKQLLKVSKLQRAKISVFNLLQY